MKDSGIPWIGEIPEGWVLSRIKNCTDIVMGQSPDGDSISSEPVGYLFMQGNAEFSDKYPNPSLYCQNPNKLSRVGDILMSVRAPVGALNISDKIYGIGRGLCSIKNINIDKSYLWYYLLKSSEDFDYYGNGSTFSAITVSSLNNVPLLLPPLAEQHLIATFLDKKCSEIDSLIELQEQMIEELKAYKQSVITEAVTKGLNPNVPMKDSGIEWIGNVPEEWEVCKVSRLFHVQLGKMLQPNRENETDELCNYLCAANVGKNVLKLEPLKQMWISEREKEQYSVKKGDLLVVEGGDVASCDIINEDVSDLYIQNALHRVRSKGEQDVRVLRYLLIVAKCRGYIDLICNKATISHFTKEKFESMPYIVSPTPKEQQAIADYLDKKCGEIDELITIKQQKIESLKEYKKSVIYEYVTGKREV